MTEQRLFSAACKAALIRSLHVTAEAVTHNPSKPIANAILKTILSPIFMGRGFSRDIKGF